MTRRGVASTFLTTGDAPRWQRFADTTTLVDPTARTTGLPMQMTGNADVATAWATSLTYRSRAHLVLVGWPTGLCGLPVDQPHDHRPQGYRVCPECAIAYVTAVFPTNPQHTPRP